MHKSIISNPSAYFELVANSTLHRSYLHWYGSAALVGNKIVLAGGHSLFSSHSHNVHGKVDIWDFATQSWASATDLPAGKVGNCMVAINNTHVIIAGSKGSNTL